MGGESYPLPSFIISPMISTSIITGLDQVPREWVFEHYLNLSESLSGQDVEMKSPFNATDTKPSMYVYYEKGTGRYKFKDFSSGHQGDGVELIMQLFPGTIMSRGQAAAKITRDYEEFVTSNPNHQPKEFVEHEKFRVTSWVERGWNMLDSHYWLQYGIGSATLKHFNIKPLQSYVMEKREAGELVSLIRERERVYGFFRMDGSLHKIYQPFNKDCKFVKVQQYLQGSEQLEFKKPYLVITKALKDIACLHTMRFPVELIAPDSEDSVIPPHIIQSYKSRYRGICTLFDNDSAGRRGMERYHSAYGIKPALFKADKDPTDSVKNHGYEKTRSWLYTLLGQTLKS